MDYSVNSVLNLMKYGKYLIDPRRKYLELNFNEYTTYKYLCNAKRYLGENAYVNKAFEG